MPIRKYTKDEQRGLGRANFTSMFEQRVAVPAWGENGAIVTSFYVHNNKDCAILHARTTAEGYRAPSLDVETSVPMSVNELDQFIGELKAIREDLVNEEQREQDRLTFIRAASEITAEKGIRS